MIIWIRVFPALSEDLKYTSEFCEYDNFKIWPPKLLNSPLIEVGFMTPLLESELWDCYWVAYGSSDAVPVSELSLVKLATAAFRTLSLLPLTPSHYAVRKHRPHKEAPCK